MHAVVSATPEVVSAAQAQVEQGFAAFALRASAKVPITEHGFKNATTRPDWIATQLKAPGAGNYGITWPTDAERVVLALDLDNGSDGSERPWEDRLLELIARIGPLPPTKTTTTPSGGRHAFYGWPAGVPVPAGDELFGFTVRWPGRGYLVGPGSSINGRPYVAGPMTEIVDLPAAWVYAALAEHPSTRSVPGGHTVTITGSYELPDRIPSGRRYAAIRDYVASRYNAGLSTEELWQLVVSQVAPRFTSPKTEDELRADFARVMDKIDDRLGPPARAARAAPQAPSGPLEDAALTEFVSSPIEWLWPAWLARGVVTLMDGNPGVSKSTVVADLVARITTGRPWPDESPMPAISRRVLWVTTEDDPGRVLRPRIEAAEGNAGLVRFVKSEVVFPSGAEAFAELVGRRSAEPEGLALVILDPLFSHLDANVRTISDNEMRKGVMDPLGDIAETCQVAILVVRHFNKDTRQGALNRGAGSLGGIVGAARALWTVALDPEDDSGETKAIGVEKLNYARPKLPLRYRVRDVVPPGWISGSVSGVEWIGEASVSISTMLTEDNATSEAVPVLASYLRSQGGHAPTVGVYAHMKARGFGRDATRGAQRRLHIKPVKVGMAGGWTWSLPGEEVEVTDGDVSSDSSGDGPEVTGGDVSSDSSDCWNRRVARSRVGAGGRAPAGGARSPDSSDSSGDSGRTDGSDLAELTEESGDGAPPARTRARDRRPDQPVLTVVTETTSEWLAPCHFYADHRTAHRWAETGWICEICAPSELLPGVPVSTEDAP